MLEEEYEKTRRRLPAHLRRVEAERPFKARDLFILSLDDGLEGLNPRVDVHGAFLSGTG